jgi:hypothetical protein
MSEFSKMDDSQFADHHMGQQARQRVVQLHEENIELRQELADLKMEHEKQRAEWERTRAELIATAQLEIKLRTDAEDRERVVRRTLTIVSGHLDALTRDARRVHAKLVHGETRLAQEILSQTIARVYDDLIGSTPTATITTIPRVVGRFVGSGQVSLTPDVHGLTVRFDDSGAPDFWCAVTIAPEPLLSLLGLIFRAAHAPHFNPDAKPTR